MSPFEIISSTIAVIAIAVNIAALLFLGLQVRQGVQNAAAVDKARQEEWVRRRKEASMQFYMSTLDRREHRMSTLPPDRDGVAIKRYLEDVESDNSKHSAVRTYLSYLEMLGTGVNSGVLDIEVIELYAGGTIVATWNNYGEWIAKTRVKFQSPRIYCQFEMMARDIAQRRSIPMWAPDSIEQVKASASDESAIEIGKL
ncbi:DUF4760 domain-containing protein [Nocardia sp. NPDC049149]|uniref:DUF4760 domain-containing protein n=1 Tax=Nocardia sp. NPDC049149 TaxID=3364315 RepID=UPI00371B8A55